MTLIVSTSVVSGIPGGVVTAAVTRRDSFTPTAGQTVFTLTATPTDAMSVEVDVNGQSFSPGSGAFTLAGSAVTWTGAYALEATDTVVITYV